MTQTRSQTSDDEESGADESESDGDQSQDSDSDSMDEAPARAGVIESISLRNFMCHDSFELSLGPQINFIIGRNGSGKSAILTGISVGLGAKATDTNRGSSIKDLIKDGKATARTSITLLNEGPEAFQPKEYGNRIIVERKLQRVGAHSYAIKSSLGKVVSTKKQVLDEILYKFSITIDNPLAFLSQDKAREFLTSTTDHTKYEYFMAGTFIQDIMGNFELTTANIIEVLNKLKQARAQRETCGRRYKEVAALYNQYKKSDYLRTRLQVIHGKIYWFNVKQVELKIGEYELRITKLEDEQVQVRERIAETTKILEERDPARAALESRMDQMAVNLLQCTDKYKDTREAREKMNATLAQMRDEITNHNNEITRCKKLIARNQLLIDKEQQRIEDENGGLKEKLLDEVNRLKEQRAELETRKRSLKKELDDLEHADTSEEIRGIQQKIRLAEESCNALKLRQQVAQNQRSDVYAPWGPKMKNIMRDVRATQSWHSPPIGPLGAEISVKQQYKEWSLLLNSILSKTLDSFVVADEHDRKILDAILRKQYARNSIIVRKSESFLFDSGKATCATTVLDMLDIRNDGALYTLIDNNVIERLVIAKDKSQMYELAHNHNVALALALYMGHLGMRATQQRGSLKVDPVTYFGFNKFSVAGVSTDEQLRELARSIDEERANISAYSRELLAARRKQQMPLDNCSSQLKVIETLLRELDRAIRNVENKMEEDGDFAKIETLKAENDDYLEQINRARGVVSSFTDELEQQASKFEELKDRTRQAKSEYNEVLSQREALRAEITDLEASQVTTASDKKHYEYELLKRQTQLETFRAKIGEGAQKLASLVATAEAKCKREDVTIGDNEDQDSIAREYSDIQHQVEGAEMAMGKPLLEVQAALAEARQFLDTAQATEQLIVETSRKLNAELNVRFNCMHTTILSNVQQASRTFENALALRGFQGNLEFDFNRKALTLLAQLRMDDQMRRVDTLSGGEKSFAQISLLLAIWKVMDSRIRGLDEFDVYMDSVNRSISIKLLLNELRQYPKSQNIFITPQDIAIVGDVDGENVRIHKMSDPRDD